MINGFFLSLREICCNRPFRNNLLLFSFAKSLYNHYDTNMEKQMELRQLTYAQMRDLIESNDSKQIKGYISEGLAMLQGSPFELLSQIPDAPFRFDEMRLLITGKGEVHPIINLRQFDVHAGDLVFVSGGSIAQPRGASSDVRAKGMSCTNELLALAFEGRLPTILKRPQLSFVLHLTDAQRQFIESLHTLLWQAVHDKDLSPQVVLRLVSVIMTYVDHLYSLSEKQHTSTRSHEEEIFDRFIALVNRYGAREHQLPFYAGKIFLSQRYLGAIISKVSGKTAKEWIDNAIIMEAKVMLKHTDMPVNRIADELNFDNYSFFSRYFRRLTGMSPQDYRKS